MTDIDDRPQTLAEAAEIEQEQLWDDLAGAVASAHRGCWSMQCENLEWRITNLAQIVGATGWSKVQVSLLRSGVYERILKAAGVTFEPIDWDAVARTEAAITEGLS